jgi:hypothetical protein
MSLRRSCGKVRQVPTKQSRNVLALRDLRPAPQPLGFLQLLHSFRHGCSLRLKDLNQPISAMD